MSKVLSIEVGNSLTKIVEMDYKSKNPKVYKCINIPTPDEVFDDGYISDSKEYAGTLRQALADNKIKTRQAVCTITCSKIANREIMLPNVKLNQVDDLIRANASEYFPVDLSQYELGYIVLGRENADTEAAKLKVMLLACEKELIQGYDTLFEQAGLKLVGVDYAGNSVVQIMKKEVTEETEMVIKVEEQSTIATIIRSGELMMQRNLGYGIDNTVQTMMSYHLFNEDSYGKCIDLLKEHNCIYPTLSGEDEETLKLKETLDKGDRKAMTDMTEALGPLVGNVGRVLDLYNSKNVEHPITKVSMIGLGSQIAGLDKLFTNELGVTTESVNSVKSVTFALNAQVKDTGEYLTAMGASISPVGFIEDQKKADAKKTNYLSLSILCLLLIGVIIAAMYIMAKKPYEDEVLQKTTLELLEKKYEPALKVKEQCDNVSRLYEEVVKVASLTDSNNDGLVAFLTELEAKLPSNATVEAFQSDNNQATFTIKVPTMMDAAGIINTVREFETLADVRVGSISKTTDKEVAIKHENKEVDDDFEEDVSEETYYTFNLECIYHSNGATGEK
ncbi:type IV pilus assembly protein PilM [Lachnospiraceae bacterium YSD2013]|nr:type IV pilus assembly protein PilM [Lachnospiraceae bacterium YSD2013]